MKLKFLFFVILTTIAFNTFSIKFWNDTKQTIYLGTEKDGESLRSNKLFPNRSLVIGKENLYTEGRRIFVSPGTKNFFSIALPIKGDDIELRFFINEKGLLCLADKSNPKNFTELDTKSVKEEDGEDLVDDIKDDKTNPTVENNHLNLKNILIAGGLLAVVGAIVYKTLKSNKNEKTNK